MPSPSRNEGSATPPPAFCVRLLFVLGCFVIWFPIALAWPKRFQLDWYPGLLGNQTYGIGNWNYSMESRNVKYTMGNGEGARKAILDTGVLSLDDSGDGEGSLELEEFGKRLEIMRARWGEGRGDGQGV